jgi:hypothetical protein
MQLRWVKIKPGRSDETLAMIRDHGEQMLHGLTGSKGGYWTRTVDGWGSHPAFLLAVRNRGRRRLAEATFNTLREMPEAPAVFVSVNVCEVVGEA